MKTKGQKKRIEEMYKKIKKIIQILAVCLLLFIGFVYYNNIVDEGKSEINYSAADDTSSSGEADYDTQTGLTRNSNGKSSASVDTGLNDENSVDSGIGRNNSVAGTARNNSDSGIGRNDSAEGNDRKNSDSGIGRNDSGAGTDVTGLIDINTASVEELCRLKGIGEKRAGDIIAYREEHGGFSSVEEIMNVKGIKTGIFEKIKDSICVSNT